MRYALIARTAVAIAILVGFAAPQGAFRWVVGTVPYPLSTVIDFLGDARGKDNH